MASDVAALVVTPREARTVARDLLNDGMLIAQGVCPSVPGLRFATAHVPARRTGAQVESAAALLALVSPGFGGDGRCVLAKWRLIENGGVHDLHNPHKVLA